MRCNADTGRSVLAASFSQISVPALRSPFSPTPVRLRVQTDGYLIDLSSSKLTALISALESEKFTSETFKTYLTEVGGHGLGILSQPADTSDLPTPPTQESLVGSDMLETTFADTPRAELRGWVEALGKWAYV